MASGPLFYTYVHRRADDGVVFYVGKGKGYRASSPRNRNRHWLRTVAKHGLRAEIVARWATEAEAFAHEIALISDYRKQGLRLCNCTDGGDGVAGHKHSPETRAKLSAIQVGKKLSAEHRAKLAGRKGWKHTDEAKAKMSAALKGRKHSEEQRRKNSEARRGKKRSAEAIAKAAAALRGRSATDETRAKIAAAHRGMTASPATRAKISAANKGRVRSDEFKQKVSAALKAQWADGRRSRASGGVSP